MSVFAIPSLSNVFNLSLKSVARELATVTRETYNAAVITGRVHRVVFDIENNSYWAEQGGPDFLMENEESLEIADRKAKFRGEEDDEEKKNSPKKPFEMDRSITRSKKELPVGVKFTAVYTERSPEPIEDGIAYTHIFPHGITEQTVIQLEDNQDHQVSLIIQPITGKTRMVSDHITLKEVLDE